MPFSGITSKLATYTTLLFHLFLPSYRAFAVSGQALTKMTTSMKILVTLVANLVLLSLIITNQANACGFMCLNFAQDIDGNQPDYQPFLKAIKLSPVLFEGAVREEYPCSDHTCTALFEVHKAWRRVETDLVLVQMQVDDGCGGYKGPFTKGEKYLIFGNSFEGSRTEVSIAKCDMFLTDYLSKVPEAGAYLGQLSQLAVRPTTLGEKVSFSIRAFFYKGGLGKILLIALLVLLAFVAGRVIRGQSKKKSS